MCIRWFLHLTRVWRISKRARTYEKKKLIWARISNPNTVQIDRLPQVKYTCVDLRKAQI